MTIMRLGALTLETPYNLESPLGNHYLTMNSTSETVHEYSKIELG